MFKKAIQLTNDIFLSSVLLGVVVLAAFSVFSLSPLPAEDFGYEEEQSNVLGTSTNKLEFSEIRNDNDSPIKISSNNDINFTQKIVIPRLDSRFTGEVMQIQNQSDSLKDFKITISVPEMYQSLAKFGITINGQEFILLDTSHNTNTSLSAKSTPNTTDQIGVLIIPYDSINFELEVGLVVEEIN